MTEIEKIHFRYSTTDDVMSFENFTKALAEVFEMVKVTDEEIEQRAFDYAESFTCKLDEGSWHEIKKRDSSVNSKWSRDLSKTKLEKLIG